MQLNSVISHSDKNYMTVVGKVIKLLQSALHNSPSNIHYFENQVTYKKSISFSLILYNDYLEV